MKYYLNNAGAALMSPATLSTLYEHLKLERSIGAYQAATDRKEDVADFYRLTSEILGCISVEAIAFMDSASRAWNLALYGYPLKSGDKIVTLSSEFGTNLVSIFHFASKVGAHVEVVECDQSGAFDMHEFDRALARGGRLVAISHAAAHGSIVNPVEEVGRLAATHGAAYLVDGCQSVGQIEVDVRKIGCDAYTGTGRKWLRGPRGTGFLYVRPGSAFEPLYVDLASADLRYEGGVPIGVTIREDARRFELWERSVAGLLGLRQALSEFAVLDQHEAFARNKRSASALRNCITNQNALRLLGTADSPSSVVGFFATEQAFEGKIVDAFNSAGIAISSMSDWDCPLHFPRTGATKIFRLSPHYFTPQDAIDEAIRVIENISSI